MIKITTINEWRKHIQSLKKLNESFNEYGVHNGYLALTSYWDKVGKPVQIASVPETTIRNYEKEEVLDYLHSLEMFRYENIGENVPKWNPDLGDGKHTTENYIMFDEKTNSYYFVDTQGYDYPRYMTKLIDFTPSTEQSDSSMQLIPNNESKEIDSDDNKVAKEWNKLSKEERKKEYGQEGTEIDYEKDYENQTQSAKNKLMIDIKKKDTNPITPEANETKVAKWIKEAIKTESWLESKIEEYDLGDEMFDLQDFIMENGLKGNAQGAITLYPQFLQELEIFKEDEPEAYNEFIINKEKVINGLISYIKFVKANNSDNGGGSFGPTYR